MTNLSHFKHISRQQILPNRLIFAVVIELKLDEFSYEATTCGTYAHEKH